MTYCTHFLVRAFMILSWPVLSSLTPRNSSLSNLKQDKRWRVKFVRRVLKHRSLLSTQEPSNPLWSQSGTDLPGLRRAGSRRSGLFVAPITNTSQDLCSPSNSASSCETTLKWKGIYHQHSLGMSWFSTGVRILSIPPWNEQMKWFCILQVCSSNIPIVQFH